MKLLLPIFLSIFSISAVHANNLPVYPECFKGAVKMNDGKTEEVFLAIDVVEGTLVRMQEFQIGTYWHPYSGRLIAPGEVSFNENNDYIPGGHATYNIDIYLKFDSNGRKATGTFKQYRFKQGYGGYGQSKPETLEKEGTFKLNKCEVLVD